jgi:rhodanese-related sulfurtransferase
LLGAWIGWKFVQRQRFLRKLRVDRISPEELRQMLEDGEDIVVVDVRNALESAADSVPGALRIPLEDMEARQGDIPRDRDIILFCS